MLCIEVPAFDALSGDLAFHPILTQVVEKKLKSFFNEVGQRGVTHFYHTALAAQELFVVLLILT